MATIKPLIQPNQNCIVAISLTFENSVIFQENESAPEYTAERLSSLDQCLSGSDRPISDKIGTRNKLQSKHLEHPDLLPSMPGVPR